jgi:hypothetical protein
MITKHLTSHNSGGGFTVAAFESKIGELHAQTLFNILFVWCFFFSSGFVGTWAGKKCRFAGCWVSLINSRFISV